MNVAIVGLGVMGGSLLQALLAQKDREGQLHVVTRNEKTSAWVADLGDIHIHPSCNELPTDLDFVFLTTPSQVLGNMAEACLHLSPKTLISDMASTKGEVVPMLSSILKHHSFLSCHPMCGSEKTGLDGAKPDLYSGKTVILTPHNQKSKEHIETLKQFWTRIDCRVLEMPPQEHDRCVAWVSHMPHLVIPALVHSIEKGRSESPRVFDVAGTGLRDISRLAGSNPELWRDIFMENKAALKMALSGVMKEIRQLEEVLSLDDNNCARKLETYLRNAQGIHRDQSLSKI